MPFLTFTFTSDYICGSYFYHPVDSGSIFPVGEVMSLAENVTFPVDIRLTVYQTFLLRERLWHK